MYDSIIIGCGFCGSIIARKLAEEQDKKILVIDRRNHIAGNMYDELNSNGIRIQKYGPHVFHTNISEVYEYISRFTSWIPSKLLCRAEIDGIFTPSPFNFNTIDTFFPECSEELKSELIKEYKGRETATIVELLESSNQLIKKYAEFLFEKDYRLYTSKQWGIPPESIDVSVLKRVPVILSYEDSFFRDKYECFPKDGFVSLFENILNHKNIEVRLNCEASEVLKFDFNNRKIYYENEEYTKPVIFTGELDKLMNFKYGQLPYRSIYFDFKDIDRDRYQEVPLIVFPQAKDYTRITEYSQFPPQKTNGTTTIAYEYPLQYLPNAERGNEPYYPIINDDNISIYNKYRDDAQKILNLYVCGRLGDYKYYNMDNAIMRAFEVYKDIVSKFIRV
ncbi:UDP-galactopyranose mutase [Clostridium neonatale]|uniref:UDP-galactopyranose mutase n=1 Tax=Clostridium neonatale TaxID=137838 RepID=UPI00291BE7B1|nr:UDP-galactopyranose mutase [Clostridium neonatale]CAI3669537.1 UDP-galactopyranose mutase [Clostridium neonatale]CAI3670259.1 UDP-galactopyranose mutase [Clostridium neonatale]CAI3686472.1 UDP-galactopyranose mutase [Clostridium neonatale]CAI3716404.1 UDP-galactopyranose mutase [Clostridium neonatale]